MRKRRKERGFTLQEVLIVVGILAVVLSLSAFGYLRYRKSATYKYYNETAETLFHAAQTELSARGANGLLKVFSGEMKSMAQAGDPSTIGILDPDALRKLILEDGTTGTSYESIYSGYGENAAAADSSQIYYLKVTAHDWALYCDNSASEAAEVCYDLFADYLLTANKDLLSAFVCVEFNPAEGQVYSVFYSKDEETIEYGDTSEPLYNRTRKSRFRRNHLVGYYGVETMSLAMNKEENKIELTEVILENKEMLDLHFGVSQEDMAETLTYTVDLCDAKSNRPLVRIKVNDPNGEEWEKLTRTDGKTAADLLVDCLVTWYNKEGDPDESSQKKLSFPAWIDGEDSQIHLVLDAVDLGAVGDSCQEALIAWKKAGSPAGGVDELSGTFSWYRLGVDSPQVYARVTAAGEGFADAAVRTGNRECAAFSEAENTVDSITTIRHLNNIRFEESLRLSDFETNNIWSSVTYQLQNDLSWSDFLKSGYVFDSSVFASASGQETAGNSVNSIAKYMHLFGNERSVFPGDAAEGTTCFPSFAAVYEKAVLKSDTAKAFGYSISDLRIKETANAAYEVQAPKYLADKRKRNLYAGETPVEGAALILTNYGDISRLTLLGIQVKGTDRVAALAAVNGGSLERIYVAYTSAQPSVIEGKTGVGGVFGIFTQDEMQTVPQSVALEYLINEADITAAKLAGGIAGALVTDASGSRVQLTNSENKRQIKITTLASGEESAFIGGVAGVLADESGTDKMIVDTCGSVPVTTDRVPSSDGAYTNMKGIGIGGIAGLCCNAQIRMSTVNTNGGTVGVAGRKFVGGITGLVTGKSHVGNRPGESSRVPCDAAVYGQNYVGGIAGAAAAVKAGDQSLQSFVNNNRGWTNRKWSEILRGNDLSVQSDSAQTRIVNLVYTGRVSGSEDYVGGIAGYNNGYIGATGTNIDASAEVSGRNFTGGIAGYNDLGGNLENAVVSGGRIAAKGSFAGGIAGVNCSSVTAGHSLRANAGSVEGMYCVGGYYGGNVLLSSGAVSMTFDSKTVMGTISGQGAVGGFIGWNKTVDQSSGLSAAAVQSAVTATASKLTALGEFGRQNNNGVDSLISLLNGANGLPAGSTGTSACVSITGTGSGDGAAGTVRAAICAGGVVGFNAESSTLAITNVKNRVHVQASGSLTGNHVKPLHNRITGNTETTMGVSQLNKAKFSLSGGILGLVGEYTTLTNCSNDPAVTITTAGTYTAGICEANAGLLHNCGDTSIESPEEYETSLCGLNLGEITRDNAPQEPDEESDENTGNPGDTPSDTNSDGTNETNGGDSGDAGDSGSTADPGGADGTGDTDGSDSNQQDSQPEQTGQPDPTEQLDPTEQNGSEEQSNS